MTTTTKHQEPTKGHLTDQIAEASIKKQEQHRTDSPGSEAHGPDGRSDREADAHTNRPRHVPEAPPLVNADPAHYDNLHAGGWTPAEIAARAVVDLESISVTPGGVSLVVGDTKQLTAHGAFKGDNPRREINPSVTWVSDRPAVAAVNGFGKVTAISAGIATLTATNGTRNATVAVTVTAPDFAPAQ